MAAMGAESSVNRWDRLATYNAECERGIVHTPAYDRWMAMEQAKFDDYYGQGPVTVGLRLGGAPQ